MSALPRRNAANAYAQVGMETAVDAADPHRLISMLFEGAIKACRQAKLEMAAGNIPAKCQLISQAMDIVLLGLKAGLNMEAGGDLSQNLSNLYDYMANCLFMANAENDPAKLEEVSGLLEGLKDAWEQIPQLLKQQAPAATSQQATLVPAAPAAKLQGIA